ncbi:OFA family oxalate/formate antiporter-like MFS transporter [Oxalobacteraceae bacterium GrIS 1.11]
MSHKSPWYRWGQLLLGIVCMAMVANLQYGWTLFVTPMQDKFGWGKAAIQVAFTIFVVAETWLVPLEGYLVDRFGPRRIVLIGGVLVGLGWIMNANLSTLPMLYFAQAVGGIGAGAVYGTCVGNALKWFPDRRGLAAGLTAAGFGMGSALTILPISALIKSDGYQSAFAYFGTGQGITVVLLALFLAAPKENEVAQVLRKPQLLEKQNFTPRQTLKSPIFWVMYLIFVLMAAGGLMATAQLAPIAKDFKIADMPVSLIGLTLPALSFALSIDRILNGITRPFFGWVSDHIGRENTMGIAFSIEGVGIYLLSQYGQDPLLFVLFTGLVFFAWGEIYSLFPSTCADTFGPKFASANAGLLYTAKGTAALLVPLSSVLQQSSGGWHAVFWVAAGMNIAAAVIAMLVLKPMRRRAGHIK